MESYFELFELSPNQRYSEFFLEDNGAFDCKYFGLMFNVEIIS